jgi:hypothetical protein
MKKVENFISMNLPSTYSKVDNFANPCTDRNLGKDARGSTCRNNTFSETSRWEVIERNLTDGLVYLEAQDRSLALLGSLLDQLRKSLNGRSSSINQCHKTQIRLTHEVFVRGFRHIQGITHRNQSLFDDGTLSPLKFHIMSEGRRETIEVPRANLAQPALSALSFCPSGEPPGEPVVLDAIREIVALRTDAFRNRSIITKAREDALAKNRSRNSTRASLYGTGKHSKRSKSVTPHALHPLNDNTENCSSKGVRFFRKFFSSDARLSEI